MLKEEKNVRQNANEPRRRWFYDEEFDLIVWGEEGEEISSFQLCYNKQADEHALVWREGEAMAHYRVDQGEPGPMKNLSPMMMVDGVVPLDWLREAFEARSQEIDVEVRDFIMEKLANFGKEG